MFVYILTFFRTKNKRIEQICPILFRNCAPNRNSGMKTATTWFSPHDRCFVCRPSLSFVLFHLNTPAHTLWAEFCFLAEGAGFDLLCGAGRLGVRHAPGMPPSALGFESFFSSKSRSPPGWAGICFWRRVQDSTCSAEQAGSRLWSAPGTPFTTAPVRILFFFEKQNPAPLGGVLFFGGGCRIRTRVGFRPNGFQDRPVMTASVTLRMSCGL